MPTSVRTTTTKGAFGALAHAGFRSFTLAGMLWMMADNIEHVISYWVLYEKFASPMLAGYAVVSHWAPFLFGATFTGALADRYDCRKLFLVSMGLFMAVSLGWSYLFATNSLEVWHSVVLLTVHGIAGAIFSPASQLILHDMLDDLHIASAVRLTATSRQVGLMLGPAVGGALLLWLGPGLGIAVNALIYLPMVAWSLREKYTGHGAGGGLGATARRMPGFGLGTVINTMREASKNRTIFAMIALVGLTSLLVGNVHQALMPAFAKEFLDANEGVVYSALLLASAVGAILGGLIQEGLPRLTAPSPLKATVVAGLWAASIIVFAASSNYWVALLTQFVGGALLLSFTSMAQALVQLEAPADSRGRIIGVFNMSWNGLRIGSGMTVGFFGTVIGIHWALGLSALALLLATAGLFMLVRRQQAPLAYAHTGHVHGDTSSLGGCC